VWLVKGVQEREECWVRESIQEKRDKIYVEGFILRAMIRFSASSVGLGRRSSRSGLAMATGPGLYCSRSRLRKSADSLLLSSLEVPL
jgi:hypothetical protein